MQRITFIDRMASGRVSRRDILKSAAAFGVGVTLMPKLGQAAEVLTCLEWTGYDAPEYFGPYVAKHGAGPNFSTFGGEEEALAKVRAGFAADVMHPCNYSVGRFVEAGLTVPIDTMFWGDRWGQLRDPFGVTWAMNAPVKQA